MIDETKLQDWLDHMITKSWIQYTKRKELHNYTNIRMCLHYLQYKLIREMDAELYDAEF